MKNHKNIYIKKLLMFSILLSVFNCARTGYPSNTDNAISQAADKAQKGLKEIELSCKNIKLIAELAISPKEQETGLMHRKELPEGRGMLFVYDSDRRLSFWMKNTLVPLSIAYIGSDGTIKEIYNMEALSLSAVSSSRSVRYALEVPKGWFEKNAIAEGDRFNLPDALTPRP